MTLIVATAVRSLLEDASPELVAELATEDYLSTSHPKGWPRVLGYLNKSGAC